MICFQMPASFFSGGLGVFTPSGFQAYPVPTYTTAVTAVDVAADLQQWLSDAARPWAGSVTFVVSFVSDGLGRNALRVASSQLTTWLPDADFAACMGLAVTWTVSEITGTGIRGTVHPNALNYRSRLQWDKAQGVRSNSGSFVTSVPGMKLKRPQCSMVLTEGGVLAMTTAAEAASCPRRAHINVQNPEGTMLTGSSNWELATVGKIQQPNRSRGGNLYTMGLDVMA